MEMDMLIPLKLNLNKKKESTQQLSDYDSISNEGTSPSKPAVFDREQDKKRLLAFAQQWSVTNENLNADKSLQKRPNEHGTLKYTYVVEGEDGKELSFPAHLIQYTKTEPSISYCENIHYAKGAFQSRKEVLDDADEDVKRVMYFIMNSTSPTCQNPEFPGRYRKWYVNKKTFVGKYQDGEQSPCYSPHWETDSEEEPSHQDPTNFGLDFLPRPSPALLSRKVISKVKINKVELPFFEDDDFLTNLITPQVNVQEKPASVEPSITETKDIREEYSAFMSSLQRDVKLEDDSEVRPKSSESPGPLDWEPEDEKVFRESHEENRRRKRSVPSPDWDEQWRSSSRYQHSREKSRRNYSPSPRKEAAPHTPDEYDTRTEEDWVDSKRTVNFGEGDAMTSDAKRISLDERLELELGIKVESELPSMASMMSPQSTDYMQFQESPRRRRGFGPKAAPLGALIFMCPKALPAAPYIPPHLQSLLCQPLVRSVAAKVEDKTELMHAESSEVKEELVKPEEKAKKDWDKELKNLEAVASNLEAADETVLEALEEKLLQFETSNILQSGGDSPPLKSDDVKEEQVKANKRPKRPKPPPVELKEAGKGILVMPRVSLLDDDSVNHKKAVVFADNVRPGCGTSSEDEEEHVRSPPPPVVPVTSLAEASPKKKKKRKKVKYTGDDFDPVYDLLPPPSPPPGSPPPHLPQGSSPTPAVDTSVASSPQTIESGAC